MKLFQPFILLFLPFVLFSQQANKIEFTNDKIDVIDSIRVRFGEELAEQIENMDFDIRSELTGRHAILHFYNLLEKDKNKAREEVPGACRCVLENEKIEIITAIGFLAGIANINYINLSDSTYKSEVHYFTDGEKTHKSKIEDAFVEDIIIPLEKVKLELSSDSNLEHLGMLKGRLIGNVKKHYAKSDNEKGYKAIEIGVMSVFECRLIDFERMMAEMSRGKVPNVDKEDTKKSKN